MMYKSEAGAFILKITYGYNIEPHGEDPLVSLADLALQQFSNAIVPGAWLVDLIPACEYFTPPKLTFGLILRVPLMQITVKYIPEWFPGANFRKVGRYYFETLTKLVESPLSFTKYQMKEKKEKHSFTSALLEQGEDESIVKWSALALYSGGADTVSKPWSYLILSMHDILIKMVQI